MYAHMYLGDVNYVALSICPLRKKEKKDDTYSTQKKKKNCKQKEQKVLQIWPDPYLLPPPPG
jgi:hypothetical protein